LNFMMVLNNLFPVFALILFGVLLRRWHLTDEVFLKTADKLTYYIFFPLLLFWKIGGASTALFSKSGMYKAVLCTIFAVYVLSTIFIMLFKVPDYQAGIFSQSCYRLFIFNVVRGFRAGPQGRPDLFCFADIAGAVYPYLPTKQ